MSVFFLFISFLLYLITFFLPIIIASIRNHKNLIPIIIFSILFNITVIGYIIALIWAFSSNVDETKPQKYRDSSLLAICVLLIIFSTLFGASVIFSGSKYKNFYLTANLE